MYKVREISDHVAEAKVFINYLQEQEHGDLKA